MSMKSIKESNENYVTLKSALYDKENAIVSLSNSNLQNTDAIAALADKMGELVKEIERLKNNQIRLYIISSTIEK